ncbi:MAG: protein kinase [Candidatus Aminicenantes bacterium]|nr:protein kinase [Candidatus Aminicenantes bacterium]
MDEYPAFPGCKIVGVLGKGGMATVYLATQDKLKRKVAIKVLHSSLLKNKETANNFKKEAKTAAGFSHSNIVQIFDTGKAGDHHYIIMEYLDTSLRDRMERNLGKMPEQLALDIVEKIMEALDYAHFQGVYHRDIKPENIMFRHDSTPVLVDFGISCVSVPNDQFEKVSGIAGTVDYMSPEQCRGQKNVDDRSDVYSLGVLLYEMLTGEKPYKGDSYISVALKHMEEPVPRLPGEFSRYQPLIDKMMAKDREERLSSAPQFDKLLYSILSGPAATSTPSVDSAQAAEKTIPAAEPPLEQSEEVVPSSRELEPASSISRAALGIVKSLVNNFPEPIKKKLDLFMEFPLKKRLVLGSFLVVIILLMAIILFVPGNGSKNGIKKDNNAYAQAVSKNTMKLRSGYKNDLSEQAVAAMIQRRGFFEKKINKSADFKCDYQTSVKERGEMIVIYNKTAFVWHGEKMPDNLTLQEAEERLENLNNRGYGGYDDWRFPTIEEAASLLRKTKNREGLHIDSAFSRSPRSIWTKDSIIPGEYWIVNFYSGTIELSSENWKHSLRPVRSFFE